MIEILANIPAAWWVAAGTFVATVGLKVIEKWLNSTETRRADRKDHRDEVSTLQARLDKVEEEVTEWRQKYYDSTVEIAALKRALILAGIDVPDTRP